MRLAPALLLATLPLFAACQWLPATKTEPSAPTLRLQGELTRQGDDWQLRPCGESRTYRLEFDRQGEPGEQIAQLAADSPGALFVDLRGSLEASGAGLRLQQLYRLQGEGRGCRDSGFKRLILRASGNEPFWSLQVTSGGMVLERLGSPALALPYLEERLPDGSLSLSSEANGQRLELWLSPGLCRDDMSGALQHLRARLRLDQAAPLTGCASFGGARD